MPTRRARPKTEMASLAPLGLSVGITEGHNLNERVPVSPTTVVICP